MFGLSYVSVEPVMTFYMMAFMLTSVVEQVFFVYKACSVNHGQEDDVCFNLHNVSNSAINNQIQITVSTFHQWNGIAGHIVPIILAFFLGAWSDKRGRKGVMLAGLTGKLYYSLMIIVTATQKSWPLEYVIYFATLPSALTGADVAVFASAFMYISDITTPKNRTLRVSILDVCYLSTIPTGVALGNYLYQDVLNKSFSLMFTINASLLVCAIIYTYVFLKWKTTSKHQSMTEANAKHFLCDFFDKVHFQQSIKTLTKRRPGNRRCYLLLMMVIMILYTFQRDEKPMLYLYMVNVFNWDSNIYSKFKTFQSSVYVISMLIGIPLMSSYLKFRDTTIIIIGAVSHALGRFVFAFAKNSDLFYLGAVLAALGPCVAPVLRSLTSKSVPVEERGKVFAFLSVCDNAVALFSATLYSQLYNATIDTNYLNAIFFLTIGTQVMVLLLTLIIHISLGSEPIEKYSTDIIITANEEDQSNAKMNI